MNHQHLLVRATVNNPPQNTDTLNKWLLELVEAIDMKVLMKPKSKYLKTKGNRGITGIVVIETSHISIHCWDEESPALAQLDVYSCKEFKSDTVIQKLKEFELLDYATMSVNRNDWRLLTSYHYPRIV